MRLQPSKVRIATAANNDFVGETDNGCFSLPTPAEVIISLQEADPRWE